MYDKSPLKSKNNYFNKIIKFEKNNKMSFKIGNFSKNKNKKDKKKEKINKKENNTSIPNLNNKNNLSIEEIIRSQKKSSKVSNSLKRNKSVNNCFLSEKASSQKYKCLTEDQFKLSHKKGNLSVHIPQDLVSNDKTNNLTDFDLQTLFFDESEIKT